MPRDRDDDLLRLISDFSDPAETFAALSKKSYWPKEASPNPEDEPHETPEIGRCDFSWFFSFFKPTPNLSLISQAEIADYRKQIVDIFTQRDEITRTIEEEYAKQQVALLDALHERNQEYTKVIAELTETHSDSSAIASSSSHSSAYPEQNNDSPETLLPSDFGQLLELLNSYPTYDDNIFADVNLAQATTQLLHEHHQKVLFCAREVVPELFGNLASFINQQEQSVLKI